MKHYQIDEQLFLVLLRYHLGDDHSPELEDECRQRLQAKLDAAVRREVYGRSKTADTPEEREQARQQYLDAVGIHPSFRW